MSLAVSQGIILCKGLKETIMRFSILNSSYGPFKEGSSCTILSEHEDYFMLKYKGSPFVVPKDIVDDDPVNTLFFNCCDEEFAIEEDFIFLEGAFYENC